MATSSSLTGIAIVAYTIEVHLSAITIDSITRAAGQKCLTVRRHDMNSWMYIRSFHGSAYLMNIFFPSLMYMPCDGCATLWPPIE